MVVILWIFLAFVPFLLGTGVCRCLYGREYRQSSTRGEAVLTGVCVIIGLAEAAYLAAVFLKWSLNRMALLWGGLAAAGCAAAALIMLFDRYKSRNEIQKSFIGLARKEEAVSTSLQLLMGLFALSMLLQIVIIMTGEGSSHTSDMTLEAVRSFLDSNRIYQVNPLTGRVYEEGMPLRLKILCLPGLYASVCSLTGIDAELAVERMIPVAVLAASYLAYGSLGRVLFGKDQTGRSLMLWLVSLIYWFGDYLTVMDGFQLLHCGYRGTAVRNGVLIPFALSMCLQKRWKAAALAILAEACIVWTLYGMGCCFFITISMLLLHLWMSRKQNGEEKVCRRS